MSNYWRRAPVDLIKLATHHDYSKEHVPPDLVPYLDAFDALEDGSSISARVLARRYGISRWRATQIVKRARSDFEEWHRGTPAGHSSQPIADHNRSENSQQPATEFRESMADSPNDRPPASQGDSQPPAQNSRSRARYSTEQYTQHTDPIVGSAGADTDGAGLGGLEAFTRSVDRGIAKAREALAMINAANLEAHPHLGAGYCFLRWSEPHKDLITWMARSGDPASALLIVEHAVAKWASNEEMRKYIRQSTLFGPKNRIDYLDQARAWDAAGRPSEEADPLGLDWLPR